MMNMHEFEVDVGQPCPPRLALMRGGLIAYANFLSSLWGAQKASSARKSVNASADILFTSVALTFSPRRSSINLLKAAMHAAAAAGIHEDADFCIARSSRV